MTADDFKSGDTAQDLNVTRSAPLSQKPGFSVHEVPYQGHDYFGTVQLRREVLRYPLGHDLTPEDLQADRLDTHLALISDRQKIVGCLVLKALSPVELKMRQVAIDGALQGKGLGQLLVAGAEHWAIQNGYRSFVLNARETAVPFYLRLGYEVFGEPFEEVSLPHRKMRKTLI